MVVKNIGGLGGLGGMPAKTPEQPSGFSNFVQSPDFGNVLQSLGLSLMSSPSNAPLSSMPTILSGVQAQSMRQRQEQLAAEERQKKTEKANATRTWLETNQPDLVPIFDVDPGAAITALVDRKKGHEPTSDMQEYQYAASQGYTGSFADWQAQGTGGGEFGLTPIWGQRADGSFGYGVQGKDGSFLPVDTGDLKPLDPRSLAGERAYGTSVGDAQGDAAAAAPGDITSGQMALDLVEQIKTSKELPWATGTSAGLGGNAVPGTGRFGFQNLVDQAKSGAFLTAIQQMRGMGALSNNEGQAATQAITRMNTALSQQDFVAALDDYERIIKVGMQKAAERIGAGPNVGSPPPAAGTQTPNAGFQILSVE